MSIIVTNEKNYKKKCDGIFFHVFCGKVFENFFVANIKEMATEKNAKNAKKYFCEKCDFTTCNKNNFNKHLETIKHKSNISATCNNTLATQKQLICENCGKTYNDRTGLWRHKKKCDYKPYEENDDQSEEEKNKEEEQSVPPITPEIVGLLIQQNKDMHSIMMELAKNGINTNNTTNTNSHNTTNSHNKTFNLQIFLNETCKDAMNIMDFVQDIVLTLNDLEETGRIGFAEGISKMINKRLKALDVTQRPIHCSDLKRETLYIKNENKWEKEEDNKPVLTNAVKHIAGKNMMQIFDWQKANPDYNDPETRTSDKYMKMLTNVMSGGTEEEINANYEKIIRNLIKEAAIDKEKFMV